MHVFDRIKSTESLKEIFLNNEERFGKKDQYDRFLYSYLSKKRNIQDPEISKTLHKDLKITWPNNHKFSICLTHDVDNVFPSWKYFAYVSYQKFFQKKFIQSVQSFLNMRHARSKHGKNPYWTFDAIRKLEKKYNADSSFYFMVDNDRYKIKNMKGLIQDLQKDHCEIGHHLSFDCYKNLEITQKEKHILEDITQNNVIGCRAHYLKFHAPDTWNILEQSGYRYDTSYGYPDQIGFKNGLCHPFYPVDNNNKNIDLLEIPLALMDASLFEYMDLSFEDAWNQIKTLIDTVHALNGVLVILWHNDRFDTNLFGRLGEFYSMILEYGASKNAWMTSGENIYNHWTQNVIPDNTHS